MSGARSGERCDGKWKKGAEIETAMRSHVRGGHALHGRGQWCDGSRNRSLLRGWLTFRPECGCGRWWCGSGCVRGWCAGMSHGSRRGWTGGESLHGSQRGCCSGTRLRGRWSARSRCTLRCCRWWYYRDRTASLRFEMSMKMAVWGILSLHVQSDQSRDEKTCGWKMVVVLGRVRESRRWCGNGREMRCGRCRSRRSWCRGTRGFWLMA
jgi:hypothetical protein